MTYFIWVMKVEVEGLTGNIKFDEWGLRTEFELQIVELKKHGLEKVAFFCVHCVNWRLSKGWLLARSLWN